MRTLYLDSYLGPVQDRSVFEASVSPHDYDVVVWEPHHTFRRYEDRANGNLEKGRPALSVDIGGKLRALTNEWRKRFREYMVDGGILVVLLPDDVRLMLERDLERIAELVEQFESFQIQRVGHSDGHPARREDVLGGNGSHD